MSIAVYVSDANCQGCQLPYTPPNKDCIWQLTSSISALRYTFPNPIGTPYPTKYMHPSNPNISLSQNNNDTNMLAMKTTLDHQLTSVVNDTALTERA